MDIGVGVGLHNIRYGQPAYRRERGFFRQAAEPAHNETDRENVAARKEKNPTQTTDRAV